jgi:hypothetical protein
MKSQAQLGGILAIVSGVLGIVNALGCLFFIFFIDASRQEIDYGVYTDEDLYVLFGFFALIGVILALISILSIVGGILAYRKTSWGWALAGAIAASLVFYPAGIAAVIFVSLGKLEFGKKAPATGLISPVSPPVVNHL